LKVHAFYEEMKIEDTLSKSAHSFGFFVKSIHAIPRQTSLIFEDKAQSQDFLTALDKIHQKGPTR
jgi:hypothetical protein